MAAGTMPVGGRQHVFEKLASILGLVAAPLMLLGLSACGRSAGKTSEPTCPTEPVDAADSSTTPDPSCVVRATEINGNGSRIQTWTGSYDAAATQSGGVCGGTCNFHATVRFTVDEGQISGSVDQVYQAAMVAIATRPTSPSLAP